MQVRATEPDRAHRGAAPVSAPAVPAPAAAGEAPAALPSLGFHRALDRLDRVLGVVFIGVVALNFTSAASRYVAGRPIIGADEVQVYVMVWLVFMGAVMAAMRRAHLRMDVLTMNLGARPAWWRHVLEMLLALAVSATMVGVSSQFVWQIHGMDQRSDAAEIPMWLPHLSVALGFAGLALAAALELRLLLQHRPR